MYKLVVNGYVYKSDNLQLLKTVARSLLYRDNIVTLVNVATGQYIEF